MGLNLYQTYSLDIAGNYTAPMLLGVSKRSLLAGGLAAPAFVAITGWEADTSFSLAPSLTQARTLQACAGPGEVMVTQGRVLLINTAEARMAHWLMLHAAQRDGVCGQQRTQHGAGERAAARAAAVGHHPHLRAVQPGD